ncbi:hypothetical protein ACLB1R_05065 [Escherichia coli]
MSPGWTTRCMWNWLCHSSRHSAFEELKEQCSAELLRITGAKAIDWETVAQYRHLKTREESAGY